MPRATHRTRLCAAPGCDRPLAGRWPHPLCPDCRDTPLPAPRDGTRQAMIPRATTTAEIHYSAVTLPAEPWRT